MQVENEVGGLFSNFYLSLFGVCLPVLHDYNIIKYIFIVLIFCVHAVKLNVMHMVVLVWYFVAGKHIKRQVKL